MREKHVTPTGSSSVLPQASVSSSPRQRRTGVPRLTGSMFDLSKAQKTDSGVCSDSTIRRPRHQRQQGQTSMTTMTPTPTNKETSQVSTCASVHTAHLPTCPRSPPSALRLLMLPHGPSAPLKNEGYQAVGWLLLQHIDAVGMLTTPPSPTPV